jgi:hypothetical protein
VEALESICSPAQQRRIAAVLPHSLFLGEGLGNLAEQLAKL